MDIKTIGGFTLLALLAWHIYCVVTGRESFLDALMALLTDARLVSRLA